MPWTAGCLPWEPRRFRRYGPGTGLSAIGFCFWGWREAALTRGTVSWLARPSVVLLGMTGAMALACFVKV